MLVTTTQVAPRLHPLREAAQIASLILLAIVLVTHDLRGPAAYVLLGVGFLVALNGYRRIRRSSAPSPWECNDEY